MGGGGRLRAGLRQLKISAKFEPGDPCPDLDDCFSIAAYAVTRFGLITLAVAIFTANLLMSLPYTLDLTKAYASDIFLVLFGVGLVAAWGFYASEAGQSLLRRRPDVART